MKPGNDVDAYGGSEWQVKTPEETKREEGLEELVKKVSTFFYEDDSFIKVFETFVNNNAHKIDLGTEEMKLEYTGLYDEYQVLFEREIEGFIKAQDYTVVDFYERVRQEQERDPWSHEAVFGKIMTATADFDIFMHMMREAAEAQTHHGDEKEGGVDPRPARK